MKDFHYPPVTDASLRTGCCLTSIGCLRYGPSANYPISGHPRKFDFNWEKGRVIPDFVLIFVTEGRGAWETRHHRADVVAGDALYLVPGGWHRYRPESGTGWDEKWLSVRGATLHSFVNAGMLPSECKHLPQSYSNDAVRQLERLRGDAIKTPRQNKPSWGARALAVLLECFENLPNPHPEQPPSDSLVEKASDFIRENSHRPILVDDVAKACGVQRRTLERHFRASGSSSVARRITAERISRAEILLSETPMQIKEIAYACGFGSVQRMIYDFHRHRGSSPGRLRNAE